MKYWRSTLAQGMPLQRMVFEPSSLSDLEIVGCKSAAAVHFKMHWRIERDYQDLKQDLGLGRFGAS